MISLRPALSAALLALSALTVSAQVPGKLLVDFIDVEGGQATLFITPAGQSLLIDTGWAGNNNRDADRIVAAARQHGLSRIDFVLITHFHDDHVGGVPQLIARIPVGTFLDHGENRETSNPDVVRNYAEYQKLLASGSAKHIVAQPGNKLPIRGLDVTVISADGKLLAKPLPGAGAPNLFCDMSENRPPDTTENARSLGIEITFGKLKILDLGDLTWDKEMQLMCPVNRLGAVDILVVSHHGWYQSSSPALVLGVHPRVAIMDNGADKGGSLATFSTFNTAPGLEALWQLHYSNEAGAALNRPAEYIANPQGADAAHSLELTADPDGSFTMLNTGTGVSRSYPPKL